MAQFSRIASILISALLVLCTSAAPMQPTPSASQLADFPVESPLMEMPSPSPEFAESPSPEPINEGCVAVEHLQGYALQHARHFKRRVLCAEGFCATSNHAIVVDGVMTSMKLLCAGQWKCVETEKMVNNLNLFVNAHAKINDRITVTPYDIRFPRWCVVVAQAMELTWNTMTSISILAVTCMACMAALFHTKRSSKMQ